MVQLASRMPVGLGAIAGTLYWAKNRPPLPLFAIEPRSSSDALMTVEAKLQEYISNGAALGWLIDRKTRTVHIYRPNCEPEILTHPPTVSGDPELPGFVLPMARVW